MPENHAAPRVLFLFNHAGQGGTERCVEILVDRLAPKYLTPFLAYNETGPLCAHLEARGVPVFHLPMGSRFDRVAARRLAALCHEHRIDIVNAMFLREHYIAWLSSFFGNRAVRMASVHLMLDKPARPPLLWLDRAVYRGMGAVTTVCRPLARQIRDAYGLPEKSVHVVYNGVARDERMPEVDTSVLGTDAAELDDDAFGLRLDAATGGMCQIWAEARAEAVRGDRESVRAEFGFSPEDLLFVTAGRLSEEKGHDFLLAGILRWRGLLPEGVSRVKFLVAGDGPMRAALEQEIRDAGLADGVVLAGYRQDVPRLLRAADAYIVPSRTEAQSLSILEAMEAGLPVIATSVGGTPEILHPDWGNGVLVPHGDADALAKAILSLAGDAPLRTLIGWKALLTERTRFSQARMADMTGVLYKDLADKKHKG